MSRNDRWRRVAVALADNRYDDALDDLVAPVVGDFPPLSLLKKQFDHPRLFRIWQARTEKAWLRWIEDTNLTEDEQFFLNREFSSVYDLQLQPRRQGRKRKYRTKA